MEKTQTASGGTKGKKLLERATEALRAAGVNEAHAARAVGWMRKYILFHDRRHPGEMGMNEIRQFLNGPAFDPDGREERAWAERSLKFLYESVLDRRWPGTKAGRTKSREWAACSV
jgi:hypothetical protein